MGRSTRYTSFTKRQQPASWPVRKVEGISMMTRTAINRTSIGACVWHCLSVLLLSRGDSNIRILVTVAAVDVCDWNHFSRSRPREIVSTSDRRAIFENNWTLVFDADRLHRRIVRHGDGERAIHIRSVDIAPGEKCRVLFKNCGHILILLYVFGYFTWTNSNVCVWMNRSASCNMSLQRYQRYQRIFKRVFEIGTWGKYREWTLARLFGRGIDFAHRRDFILISIQLPRAVLSMRIYVGNSDARRRPSFATAAQ